MSEVYFVVSASRTSSKQPVLQRYLYCNYCNLLFIRKSTSWGRYSNVALWNSLSRHLCHLSIHSSSITNQLNLWLLFSCENWQAGAVEPFQAGITWAKTWVKISKNPRSHSILLHAKT